MHVWRDMHFCSEILDRKWILFLSKDYGYSRGWITAITLAWPYAFTELSTENVLCKIQNKTCFNIKRLVQTKSHPLQSLIAFQMCTFLLYTHTYVIHILLRSCALDICIFHRSQNYNFFYTDHPDRNFTSPWLLMYCVSFLSIHKCLKNGCWKNKQKRF